VELRSAFFVVGAGAAKKPADFWTAVEEEVPEPGNPGRLRRVSGVRGGDGEAWARGSAQGASKWTWERVRIWRRTDGGTLIPCPKRPKRYQVQTYCEKVSG
jgi:hypothetical protein